MVYNEPHAEKMGISIVPIQYSAFAQFLPIPSIPGHPKTSSCVKCGYEELRGVHPEALKPFPRRTL